MEISDCNSDMIKNSFEYIVFHSSYVSLIKLEDMSNELKQNVLLIVDKDGKRQINTGAYSEDINNLIIELCDYSIVENIIIVKCPNLKRANKVVNLLFS